MRTTIHLLVASLCILAMSSSMRLLAQERDGLFDLSGGVGPGAWSIGITTSMTRNFHTGGFRSAYPDAWSGFEGSSTVIESGSGTGFSLGLAIEALLGPVMSLDGRIAYDRRPATFELEHSNWWSSAADPVTWTEVNEIGYDLITADLLLTTRLFRITPEAFVGLSAGVSAGHVVATSLTSWRDGYPGDATRTYVRQDAPIEGAGDWRLAAKGGVMASLRVSERVWVRPAVLFEYGVTDVTKRENWRLNSLLAQLDVMLML